VAEIACPSCDTSNPETARFCGSCGEPLERTCPSCGTANPLANRFCGSCGTALVPVQERPSQRAGSLEERKVVTMLFADLTASTEMSSRLDPEDLRSVLGPFFDAMADEIGRYGGTVEKFIGDAVVAAFGAPAAHEDDPERAIRCGLAMQRRLAELNTEVAERAGSDLAMRIGINTGEVLAHSIEEGIVTGEAVNIAARLQSLARPGRVVVGERTYRDAHEAFAFSDLGDVSVKGIDRPLRVYEVEGEAPGTGEGRERVTSPLVGRDPEMELLRLQFRRTVAQSNPNLITIVGPPGIGKSRLSDEAARAFEDEGAQVVRGRCLPYGDGLTYWPLAEILRADAGILDSDPAEETIAKARERLDPRFPGEEGMGVASVLLSSIGVELATDPLAGAEREAAQRLIARSWQRYLESLADGAPLVALIDDVHWADPSLLELLESVVARASGPIFVLCMARPDLFERRAQWGGGLSNATTISLSALSPGDGSQLIEHLLGGLAPAEVVDPILGRSEGNPFFAAELLRMMIEDSTIARRDGRWELVRELPSRLPDTVQGVIASRIDLLAPEEKRAIQDASVIGRSFWPGAVARLTSASAERAIDGLVAKGLVVERDTSTIAFEREFLFNHVLTRDVAYGSIPKARRATAHGIVGAWLEEGTAGRAEEFAEILAHHFSLAGDRERSGRYALIAGQRLLRVFAAEEAIAWFDRAMDAEPTDPRLRSQVGLARGLAKEQLGRFDDAISDYEGALVDAREAEDAEGEARALAAIAHTLWLLDRYDEGGALLPEALERARAVGLGDVEARLLYTAGTMRFGRGEFGDALDLHGQALSTALRGEDVEGQALAHHGLCETYFFVGPLEDGLEHGLLADAQFRELGQRSMVAHNGYMVAWLLGFVGRPEEAMAQANASIETSHEIGNVREEGFGLFDRAELYLSAGRLDAALADGVRGTALLRDLGVVRGVIIGENIQNSVAAEAWAFERMREPASDALELSDALGGTFMRASTLAYRAWSLLAEGKAGEAEQHLAQARAVADVFLHRAWMNRIEVLIQEWAGDADALAEIADRIERDVLPSSAYWGMWGPYARALSAWHRGRHADASRDARTALEMGAGFGDHRLVWRAARVAWRAALELGEPAEAERFREQARSTVERLVANATGDLADGFRARPDVAEVLA